MTGTGSEMPRNTSTAQSIRVMGTPAQCTAWTTGMVITRWEQFDPVKFTDLPQRVIVVCE
uniref:Uncharacterized protein n=1 Tax=Mesocestoides corti TaxID=53468 RepID=A0A5K3FGS7_MESCO